MNWNQIEAEWKQFSGKMRSKWAKLTDDDWNYVGGKKDQLIGKLQERYGIKKEEAQNEIDRYVDSL